MTGFVLDDDPASGRVLEAVQLLLRVARRLRVVVLDQILSVSTTTTPGALSVAATSSSRLLLAIIESGHEVEQPPDVTLADPVRGCDGEPTLSVGHHVVVRPDR